MTESRLWLDGMTCEHCERSVSEGIGELDGVTAVRADAATGLVEVSHETPLSRDAVEHAVAEAGYQLRSWPRSDD